MKSPSLKIEIPSPEQDRPAWPLVAVIATVGFVVGVAWPRLLGVRVGPRAPEDGKVATSATVAPSASPGDVRPVRDIPAVVAAPNGTAAVPSASAAARTSEKPDKKELLVTVSRGALVSCKGTDGQTKRGKDCGSVTGVDAIVAPKIRRLASCPAAEGVTGKLTVMAHLDATGQRISVTRGKSTIENVESVMGCLASNKFVWSGIEHDGEFTSYAVAFTASFVPKEATGEIAHRESHVAIDSALVRETLRTGRVVAKLARGTKVKVVESKEGWYRVQFSDTPGEGWIYRSALGR